MLDGVVVSAYEGIKKPNPKIFEILLERYSLVAEECLLIDDDDTNKTLEVGVRIDIWTHLMRGCIINYVH